MASVVIDSSRFSLNSLSKNPSYWLGQLKAFVELYGKLYRCSQSYQVGLSNREFQRLYDVFTESGQSEVDVCSDFSVTACKDLDSVDVREYVHYLIVICNASISHCLKRLLSVKKVPHNVDIKELIAGKTDFIDESAIYSQLPLTEVDDNFTLSSGFMSGRIWSAGSACAPDEDGRFPHALASGGPCVKAEAKAGCTATGLFPPTNISPANGGL
jgi:hypothetical protein